MNDEDLKELGAALKNIRYPKGMICPIYTEIAREFECKFRFNEGRPHTCWMIHGRHPSSVAKSEKSKSSIRNGILKRIRELYPVSDSAPQMPRI